MREPRSVNGEKTVYNIIRCKKCGVTTKVRCNFCVWDGTISNLPLYALDQMEAVAEA